MEEGVACRKTLARIIASRIRLILRPLFQAGQRSLAELRVRVIENAPAMMHGDSKAQIDIEARIARLPGKASRLVEHGAANRETSSRHRRPVAAPAGAAEDSIRMLRLARENIREIPVAIEDDARVVNRIGLRFQ